MTRREEETGKFTKDPAAILDGPPGCNHLAAPGQNVAPRMYQKRLTPHPVTGGEWDRECGRCMAVLEEGVPFAEMLENLGPPVMRGV